MHLSFSSHQFEKQRILKNKDMYVNKDSKGLSDDTLKDFLAKKTYRTHYQPFALVVVDNIRHEIILIRDHLGVCPLYYCVHENTLIFGDNLPDIIKHLPSTPSLVNHQIKALFSQNNPYSDQTFYKGIFRVEPGHTVTITPNGHIKKTVLSQKTVGHVSL